MASYRKSLEAEHDLIDIWKYIAQGNKSAATQFIDRLHSQMRDLAAMPGMGRARPEFGAEVRSFPVSRLRHLLPREHGRHRCNPRALGTARPALDFWARVSTPLTKATFLVVAL
jgi:plasmid stabilization system protein ParE